MGQKSQLPPAHPFPVKLIYLLLAVITLASYARVLGNGFTDFDDEDYVVRNRHVRAGLTWDSIQWALASFYANNWHPLTWLSLELDSQIYGTEGPQQPNSPTFAEEKPISAWGYHLTNLLLHTASVLLLFGVLRRMTGAGWASAVVAGFFAVHPLHVESVAWVAERKDVLSGLFWMLTLWAYVWYAERPGLVRYLLLVLTFAIGLTAKPMLVTLPFVLLLLDYWPLERLQFGQAAQPSRPKAGKGNVNVTPFASSSGRRLVAEKLPLLALAVICSVLTVQAQQRIVKSTEEFPLDVRILNALVAIPVYLGQMLWPANLACFYPHPGKALPIWQAAEAGAFLVGITALALWKRRQWPYLPVGWLWYLGTLVPVVGLVQVGLHSHADRYTYLPLIGVFIALTWAGRDLATRSLLPQGMLRWMAVVLLGICVVSTWIQVGYWKDSITLWQHAVDVTTNNWMAHESLGADLLQKHNPAAYVAAEQHLAIAVKLNPDFVMANYQLGVACSRLGKNREAIHWYERVLQLDPENAITHHQLAMVLFKEGKIDQAQRHLLEALRLNQDLAESHFALGLILDDQGQRKEAARHFLAAVRLKPWVNSHWPRIFVQEAWRLATDRDADRRDGALALALMQQTSKEIVSPPSGFLDTLAAVYAEVGRFDQAVPTIKRAISLAHLDHQVDVDSMKARLRLYESRQPFRE